MLVEVHVYIQKVKFPKSLKCPWPLLCCSSVFRIPFLTGNDQQTQNQENSVRRHHNPIPGAEAISTKLRSNSSRKGGEKERERGREGQTNGEREKEREGRTERERGRERERATEREWGEERERVRQHQDNEKWWCEQCNSPHAGS